MYTEMNVQVNCIENNGKRDKINYFRLNESNDHWTYKTKHLIKTKINIYFIIWLKFCCKFCQLLIFWKKNMCFVVFIRCTLKKKETNWLFNVKFVVLSKICSFGYSHRFGLFFRLLKFEIAFTFISFIIPNAKIV